MKLLTIFVLLIFHFPFVWGFFSSLAKKVSPTCCDFVGLSFFLYFDLEIAFEAVGGRYINPNFKPFFSADEFTLTFAIIATALGPWIIKAGYAIVYWLKVDSVGQIAPSLARQKVFYVVATGICAATSYFSISRVLGASAIWSVRVEMGELLGPYFIVLYIPLGILSFYIQQSESKTNRGRIYTYLLVTFGVLSAVVIGERTLLLLPILIVGVFYGTPSVKKVVAFGSVLLLGAAILVPVFKASFNESQDEGIGSTIGYVFSGDIARGPVLIESINDSSLLGTKLLKYPGAGYVYFALLFVPRPIVPFKGVSHGHVFTAHVVNETPENLNWAFGIGPVDDALINFGKAYVPIVLFAYGMIFGLLDRASARVPVLAVIARLAGVWLVGYGVACFFLFGPILLFGALCHLCFTKPSSIIDISALNSVRSRVSTAS